MMAKNHKNKPMDNKNQNSWTLRHGSERMVLVKINKSSSSKVDTQSSVKPSLKKVGTKTKMYGRLILTSSGPQKSLISIS